MTQTIQTPFLDTLQVSRLLDQSTQDSICREMTWTDDKDLATQLVDRHWLTKYHARHLLDGKQSGFYLGNYKVLQPLRSGGMGVVYVAEHVAMQRVVVLKVIRRQFLSEADRVQRFEHEARIATRMNHVNVVRTFDFDVELDTPYIVMEYVEGIDAHRQVKRQGPLDWQQAADYIRQAANGLQHIHDQDVVHRDVKPTNFLVERDGNLKILDFGLARHSSEALKEDDAFEQVGSWDFIAPEQALDSRKADVRSDIYSLGASFYFFVSGQRLFPNASSPRDKCRAHIHRRPTPIHELVPTLPHEITSTIDRMLARDPDKRIQSAAEVIEILKPFAAGHHPAYSPDLVSLPLAKLTPLLGRAAVEHSEPAVTDEGDTSVFVSDLQSEVSSGSTIDEHANLNETKRIELATIDRSTKRRTKSKPQVLKWLGAAACLVIAAVGASLVVAPSDSTTVSMQSVSSPHQQWTENELAPAIQFTNSSLDHLISDELQSLKVAQVELNIREPFLGSPVEINRSLAVPFEYAIQAARTPAAETQCDQFQTTNELETNRPDKSLAIVLIPVAELTHDTPGPVTRSQFVGRIIALGKTRLLLVNENGSDSEKRMINIGPETKFKIDGRPVDSSAIKRVRQSRFARVEIATDKANALSIDFRQDTNFD